MDGNASSPSWSMIREHLPEQGSPLRDEMLLAEVRQGNFLHRWAPIKASSARDTIELEVSTDALRVGDWTDHVRITVSATTAQLIADQFDAMLLTPRISDLIRQQADFNMAPSTFTPPKHHGAMSSTACMEAHSSGVERRLGWRHRRGLMANTGKDWVLTNRLAQAPGRAATYGWHLSGTDTPATLPGLTVLQPLSLAHDRFYTDYGQTVRMVRRLCRVNGVERSLADVLRDRRLAPLISHEGVLEVLRQPGVPLSGAPGAPPQPPEDPMVAVPRVLRRGMMGADVKVWQHVVGASPVDGIFGPLTESSTRKWQRTHALPADGVVGPLTRAVAAEHPIFIQARRFVRRRPSKPDVLVLHTTEAYEGLPSALAVAEHLADVHGPQASVHYCVDAAQVVQCVEDKEMARHAPGVDHRAIGIELTGYLRHTAEDWADPEAQTILRRTAELVATLCRRYGIQPRFVDGDALKARLGGITTLNEVALAYGEAPHNEIGEGFPMDALLEMVGEYML